MIAVLAVVVILGVLAAVPLALWFLIALGRAQS